MTTALAIENVTSGYGGTPVIRDICIEVARGEIVALLGRNGAGKTTTLMTVSGLLRTLSGTISVGGVRLRPGRPREAAHRGIAHVPEARSLFTQLSVRDNLLVACASSRAFETAYRLFPELEAIQRRRAGLLSGGEQQMLALARAIVQRPRVLMVDEMSLGLAPIICERLGEVLRRLAAEDGVGILLVEQHLKLALAVADRGFVMQGGLIRFGGTSRELAERQDEVRTAYLPPESVVSEDDGAVLAGGKLP
jgi:branched-chain amino acid transport system ATP-binding protein